MSTVTYIYDLIFQLLRRQILFLVPVKVSILILYNESIFDKFEFE